MIVLGLICGIFRTRRMYVYSRWWKEMETMLFILISVAHLHLIHAADDVVNNRNDAGSAKRYITAEITISYKTSKGTSKYLEIQGQYGLGGVVSEVKGKIVYAVSTNSKKPNHMGCSDKYANKIPKVKWISFVQRGLCTFGQKIRTATRTHNASALVVFNDKKMKERNPVIMNQKGEKDSISIFITYEDGMRIVKILERGSTVIMHVLPGEEKPLDRAAENNISKTSVLFVSISFIVLMIISLAWLVFYYIQRFRYSHAKERLARRLACAAKKAIAKIPQNTVKSGDKVLEGDHDQCAVCIEQYKPHDVIRILPCTHVFHKSCVDPWLQENRSCPMCKMDILVAYGMQIGTSQESVHHNADAGPSTQLVLEDAEVSSSVEDARAEVVLMPSICLHFNVERDDDGDGAQASSQLLGSEEGDHLLAASVHSNSGNGGGASSSSRAEKRDIEESSHKEIKALIENEFNSVKSDEDDDYENDKSGDIIDDNVADGGDKLREGNNTAVHSDCNRGLGDDVNDTRRKQKESCGDSVKVRGDSAVVLVAREGGSDNVGVVEFHSELGLPSSSSSLA